MRERPILFSGPMVRAILDGRKTQTRRVLKWQPGALDRPFIMDDGSWHVTDSRGGHMSPLGLRYAPGDRLWVREAWARSDDHEWLVAYRADGTCGAWGWDGDGKLAFNRHGLVLDPERRDGKGEWGLGKFGGKWRPSIHMPRWASRITLEVTGVKVERLQDISEADAIAEGIDDVTAEIAPRDKSLRFWRRYRDGGWNGYVDCPIGSYASLWTEINGPGSWEANPWVVAISFRVVAPDQVSPGGCGEGPPSACAGGPSP